MMCVEGKSAGHEAQDSVEVGSDAICRAVSPFPIDVIHRGKQKDVADSADGPFHGWMHALSDVNYLHTLLFALPYTRTENSTLDEAGMCSVWSRLSS
ncbi:hypothetical protein NUU61_000496 [Penicillium alfredii]|uniref:Uncharacterized protein n=1 Tax=Penicillium alfredii TaxID=1506179 RepID=A0A9W9KQY5_9EURO|nr:uncharacterized protein NUU61_000496 [Penicillium alfredii]KAJ5114737.1 hypothetical protein NUU61_000496 [Penicillium alfredii]